MFNPENIMSDDEFDIIQGQVDEARKLIEAASLQLMRCRPFYGTLISSMPVKEGTRWIATAGTDGRNLYFSPEFIAGMTPERRAIIDARIEKNVTSTKVKKEMKAFLDVFYRRKTAREVVFILEHEIRHVVADHAARGKGYDHFKYNIAADHYINTDLVIGHSKSSDIGPAWFPAGEMTKFEEDKEFGFMSYGYCDFKYLNKFTEEIYDDLFKEDQKKKKPKPQKGQGGGSGEKGDPQPGGGEEDGEGKGDKGEPGEGLKGVDAHQDNSGGIGGDDKRRAADDGSNGAGKGDIDDALGLDPSAQPRLTQDQKNANDSAMRRAIEGAVRAAGAGAPPEARKFVEDMGQPKINYLRLLRRTIERLMKQDVSYRRLSRRSYSLTKSLQDSGYLSRRQTIGLPAAIKAKTIRAAIRFDVSGSFTDALLKPTMREIRGLCNQYDDFEVTLACWSTMVGKVSTFSRQNIGDLSKYKIDTSGGTDVSCVFEELDKIKKDAPDQIVIYTDGYFSDVSGKKDWAKKYGPKTLWIILGRPGREDWTPPFGKAIMFDKYIK